MKTELVILARRAALGLLLMSVAGCSEKVDSIFRDNLPPEVRLTQAPISTQDPYFYAYRMNWVGFDPDGRIDHYLIAVDPARPDSVSASWTHTIKNEEIIFFRASSPESAQSNFENATDYHVFAIAAVDDKGAVSKPVWRAFNSFTQAPTVFIETPSPSGVFTPIVTPTVRIRWRGIDPDGQFTTKPVKYKYRLFGERNPDFPGEVDFVAFVLANPQFIRNVYAPLFGPSDKCPNCSTWDSTGADTTEVQYTNLVPQKLYVFVVTGFDEAGAYDPVFSPSSNMLKFAVTYAGTLGPKISMFNEFFFYEYPSGGYANDPTRYFNVEVPEGEPVTFNWFAIPDQGADIRRYRWVLDLQDLSDNTPRTNELTDWYHWSAYSLQTITATVGPFGIDPPDHLFFIEAEDNNGLRSLGIVHFTVVRATFEHDLLFVDDTRLTPDQRNPNGALDPPKGTWPTAAELDTFFFARGGMPWQGYPAGTLTAPGIFNGYPFRTDGQVPDTLGSRGLLSGIVPLARLGRYKVVIWYTDDIGATYQGSPSELLAPITSLRLMSGRGQPSTISTYLKQGGKVWMFGGGAAFATLVTWDAPNTPNGEWISTDPNRPELIPGRFMYDFAKWQSAVCVRPARNALINSPDFAGWGNPALGRGYSNHGIDRNLSMPNYDRLLNNPRVQMQALLPRTCGTDPPSPLRACNSFYLAQNYFAEYLGRNPQFGSPPNFIREDADPDPDVVREESTLDTLYLANGVGQANPNNINQSNLPVMTYYHGFQTPQMVFSGFPLWYFQRKQVIELVDFVMQEIFGFSAPPPGSRGPAGPQPTRISQSHAATARPVTTQAAAVPLRR